LATIHIALRVKSMQAARGELLVRQWRERFRKDPLAAHVLTSLRGRSDEIWQSAFELLQRESPEYRNSVDDEFAKESKSHCNELLRMIVAIADRRRPKFPPDPFGFVRTHAEWRARHHVPLIASLHAYRLAHRIYWGITRETLLPHRNRKAAMLSLTMLSDFWIELFDTVGAVLAEAHTIEEGLIVAQGTRTYVGLIDDLLRGLPPRDAEAQRLCALCGVRNGAPMAIALIRPHQSGNGTPIDTEVTLRSLVRLLEQALPAARLGKLVDIRGVEVTVVTCSQDAAGRGLVEALRRNGFGKRGANGLSAAVGISRDTNDFAGLPAALEEARLALEFTSTAQLLKHFCDIDLPEFLIRRADEAVFRLIPDWARHFDPKQDGQSRELLRTIRAFGECSLNVKKTARRLNLHTNTIYFRLKRIKKLTGVDPRSFSGASLLLTTLQLVEANREAGARQ
jgi:hypothetical protein